MTRAELQGIGMTSQRTRNRLVDRLRRHGIQDETVLNAIATVPRHLFVEEALASRAYEDTALPIGAGQTISQPLVVAQMTQELVSAGKKPHKVLEVGTGSGYQAAILAQLVEQVFTIERIDELWRLARRKFRSLGLRNIRTRCLDGHLGWPANAPYDAIMITAAARTVPEALFEQLADDGGILIAPIGPNGHQELRVYCRQGGDFRQRGLGDVSFVPLLPGTG